MDLPPVTLLRAFDAAGRHLSFKLAAEFLQVTPSTISHQIADLEQYLGMRLFERLPRALVLTAEGRELLGEVAAAFERLRAATARLRVAGQPRRVRISANPFFASEVLIPLIAAFEARFPEIALEVQASEALADPRDGGVDFCVRYGAAAAPGLELETLYELTAVPVVAASRRPDAPQARIDFSFRGESAWAVWARVGGAPVPCTRSELMFNSYSAAMRAVEQGLGVTVAMVPVIQPWLRAGRIAMLPGITPIPILSLSLVSRVLSPAQRRLREVRAWLLAAFREAASDS